METLTIEERLSLLNKENLALVTQQIEILLASQSSDR